MNKNIPWIEKYRPKRLEDLIYQEETIEIFRNTIKTNNLPHLLLHGPPGTGKTTSILIVAHILFGPDKVKERVMELNASDDRGINIVRTKIMNFAKENLGTPDPNYPSPPFKIIILDEADAMTKEAQSALKKIIEINSKITRFCLICNYITKIIEPIQSRCSKLRFKLIRPEFMSDRLNYIAQNEGLGISPSLLDIITESSDGDMRKAIMYLQNLKYVTYNGNKITKQDVYNITNKIKPSIIREIMEYCMSTKDNLSKILDLINTMWKNGCVVGSVMETTLQFVVNSDSFNDSQKEKICFHMSLIDRQLINGADEFIMLCSIFSFIKATYRNIEIEDIVNEQI